MGTKVAPTYACLFMGYLEQEFLQNKWHGTQPKFWRRYIDDIWFIWEDTEENLEVFIANYDSKKKSVPFLDIQVSINNEGYIKTDLFTKETAICTYLLPSSSHPSHISRNIPYSLGYRLLRICSDKDDLKIRLNDLKKDLMSRDYHYKIIDEAFHKLKNLDRKKAIEKVETKNEQKTPLVTKFHPNLPGISKIIRKHWEVMVKEDSRMARIFPTPSVVAYKRPKNLKDILVRAKVSNRRKSKRILHGYQRCGRGFFNMCVTCSLIPKSGIKTHKCNKTQEIYPITTSLTCLSDNVVYKIACKKCKDFVYIGQTSNRFCDRFLSHKSYVTSKKLDQVCGAHFNLKGHSKEDMLPIILEQVHPKNDIHLLLNREKYWINTYQSIEFGSNTQF